MPSYINTIWGTNADVFTTKPTLNALSEDEAVHNVADIAAPLTNGSAGDTDHVSGLEALCRDIGRGCYTTLDPTPTSEHGDQRWYCF
jgi:hypothetical protein